MVFLSWAAYITVSTHESPLIKTGNLRHPLGKRFGHGGSGGVLCADKNFDSHWALVDLDAIEGFSGLESSMRLGESEGADAAATAVGAVG